MDPKSIPSVPPDFVGVDANTISVAASGGEAQCKEEVEAWMRENPSQKFICGNWNSESNLCSMRQEFQNTLFLLSHEKLHTVVFKGVRNISAAL